MDRKKSTDRDNENNSFEEFIKGSDVREKADLKAVGVLSFGHLFSDVYGGFINPIMPLIALKLSIPLGFVGLMYTISSLSASLMQPFFGYLSDMLTKRFFVFWGIILSAVFMSLTGYVTHMWMLGLVLFFGSMGVGFYHPQATALVGSFSGKEINNYMGVFTACGTVGYAFGPLISASLVGAFGLKSTIAALFPGIIIALLIYKFLPKIPVYSNYPSLKDVFKTISNLKGIILNLSFIAIVRALAIMSFTVYMPFLWKAHDYSIVKIGLIISLFSLFGGFSSYWGGVLANKIGRKAVLALSLLPAVPALYGSLFFLKTMPVLSFALFVVSGFFMMSSTSVNIVIVQTAAPKNMGMVSGIIGGFCWGIVGLLLTPIGFLCSKYGISHVLSIIAFMPILGAISSMFISKKYA
ncbi:MAG: MFS transporter [bacterium]